MATSDNYRSSLMATVLLVIMVLPLMQTPVDAARFAHQGIIEVRLKEEPMCPQCMCCSAAPPGSCCKCCADSAQPLHSHMP